MVYFIKIFRTKFWTNFCYLMTWPVPLISCLKIDNFVKRKHSIFWLRRFRFALAILIWRNQEISLYFLPGSRLFFYHHLARIVVHREVSWRVFVFCRNLSLVPRTCNSVVVQSGSVCPAHILTCTYFVTQNTFITSNKSYNDWIGIQTSRQPKESNFSPFRPLLFKI